MSPRNLSFAIFAIIVLLVLIFFAPAYGWKLRAWLGPQGEPGQDVSALAAQNEVLTAQLAQLQLVASQIPQAPPNTIRAFAYSRYPLNFKNQILVSAGTNEGVSQGNSVLFQGILIGVVQKTFADSALVITVFDPTFKMPIRVGNAGVDALLQGGTYPQALSISKNAKVSAGDIVYSAGPGIPYGIPIGSIVGISASPNDLFDQATLSFAYDINSVEAVLIEK